MIFCQTVSIASQSPFQPTIQIGLSHVIERNHDQL
jgi:hypothetical protein